MDKEIILTLIVCITQIILAWLGRNIRQNVKALRRQQSVHSLYLCQMGEHLSNPEIELPTMRQVKEQLGVPRHART